MSEQVGSGELLTSIGQIAITVKQLARAVEFYRDKLGLRFLFETGHIAFFDCGGVRIMLDMTENIESTYASIFYYRASDIQAAVNRLTERGVQFEQEPRMIAKMPDHELWMAFFRDSEGNLMALMSEVR